MAYRVGVIVKLRIEGIHAWPDCDIPEVSFLKHPHRHEFHIEAMKEVSHDDRDIEIIMLKRTMIEYLHKAFGFPCNFGSWSCEMIAKDLSNRFALSSCEVLEDGENGALVIGGF